MGRGKPPSPQTTNEMKKDNSVPTLRRRAASEKRCCRNQAFRNNGHTGALLLSRPAPPLPTEKQLETQTINFSKLNLSDINRATNAREKLENAKCKKNFKNMNNCQFRLRLHAPRTTFVLKSCDFQAGAGADQGGIEPATAGLRKQARKPRDNFQRPFREQENCTAPQRERFDTHDLRRRFAETKTNSHGATARALRRARSPQRVARGPQKSLKALSY